ncbi:DUF2807 domain-containing protein [Aquimarina sp. MMG016]|uniref:GIN domain-containing protein n=1 Tax=Aquimarina sp. MMG016 TaxID=2822690 RepID=UPI001B3A5DBA|nr:DUF2807 domain-containing protein [Aquimarina sp. MMG016]MBQ4822421.1 DUF2807 domain-containing protein [Aquimarina sp. MMG016]
MRTFLILLFSIFILGNLNAQKEKVKGNKIVMTEEKIIDGFHTIDLYDNFEVSLDEDSDHMIRIEADSNLQEHIDVSIKDSILTIKSTKDLRRAKALNIRILYASELKKIIINDKIDAKSLSAIKSGNLDIETNGEAEAFFTVESGKLNSVSNGKSTLDVHVNATEVSYQVNENSELKGIVTADSLKVDLYQKGSAKLEGEIKSLLVRADSDTDFYGEKLSSVKTKLIAEGTSDCYLLVNEEINIEAIDKAEIYVLGEAKINLTKFENEVTLYKKKIDYSPSLLKQLK